MTKVILFLEIILPCNLHLLLCDRAHSAPMFLSGIPCPLDEDECLEGQPSSVESCCSALCAAICDKRKRSVSLASRSCSALVIQGFCCLLGSDPPIEGWGEVKLLVACRHDFHLPQLRVMAYVQGKRAARRILEYFQRRTSAYVHSQCALLEHCHAAKAYYRIVVSLNVYGVAVILMGIVMANACPHEPAVHIVLPLAVCFLPSPQAIVALLPLAIMRPRQLWSPSVQSMVFMSMLIWSIYFYNRLDICG